MRAANELRRNEGLKDRDSMGVLGVLLLATAVTAQKGIPSVCPYPVTWQMNQSTIIMPCNESGLTDPRSTVGWGIVDFVSEQARLLSLRVDFFRYLRS